MNIFVKEINASTNAVSNEFKVATLDSSGRLISSQLPENINARLSVLSDTDSVLSQVVLYPGELAAPTNQNYLRRGDGTTPGGQILGNGNTYVQDVIPTSPPIFSFSSIPNSGIPNISPLNILASQAIYTFVNNSGTFFNYPGFWVSTISYGEINSAVTGSLTTNHIVGVGTITFGGFNNCSSMIFPNLRMITGAIGQGAPMPTGLTTFSAPQLEYVGGSFNISGSSLSILDMNNVKYIGSLSIITSPSLTDLNISNLRQIGSISLGGSIPGQTIGLKKFEAPSLSYIGSTLTVNANGAPSLSGIYLPSIQVINGSISCSAPGTLELRDFNLGSGLYFLNGNITCTGQKLTTSSIENIFVRLSGLNGTGNTIAYSGARSINLSGGTSAGLSSLSSVALAARTALINRGITITLNA